VLCVLYADGCLRSQRYRHLLNDFEAEAFEGGDVHRGVAQQADAADSQVEEDLAAKADGADDALLMVFVGCRLFHGAQVGMREQARGFGGIVGISY